jgi:hypothetical protein
MAAILLSVAIATVAAATTSTFELSPAALKAHGGELGLGFVKGKAPLTVRHIKPASWAAMQAIEKGMRLVRLGDVDLPPGSSYDDSVEAVRQVVGAGRPVALAFEAAPPKKPRRPFSAELAAACAAVREGARGGLAAAAASLTKLGGDEAITAVQLLAAVEADAAVETAFAADDDWSAAGIC